MARAKSKQDAAQRAQGARGAKKAEDTSKDVGGERKATRAPSGARKAKRPSGLDAAAKVLAEAGEPLSSKQMVERMLEKGYWKTRGETPAATIYAAILRETQKKGEAARFRKVARGKFILAQ